MLFGFSFIQGLNPQKLANSNVAEAVDLIIFDQYLSPLLLLLPHQSFENQTRSSDFQSAASDYLVSLETAHINFMNRIRSLGFGVHRYQS